MTTIEESRARADIHGDRLARAFARKARWTLRLRDDPGCPEARRRVARANEVIDAHFGQFRIALERLARAGRKTLALDLLRRWTNRAEVAERLVYIRWVAREAASC